MKYILILLLPIIVSAQKNNTYKWRASSDISSVTLPPGTTIGPGLKDLLQSIYAPGDTIVTNLNVKAYVVNTIMAKLELGTEIKQLNTFLKYVPEYRDGSIPNDNSNVNIDTIYTDVLILIYEKLRYDVFTQAAFADFTSDITSKRNTNTILDVGCDAIDASFIAQVAILPAVGKKKLVGK